LLSALASERVEWENTLVPGWDCLLLMQWVLVSLLDLQLPSASV
jgi:hypothetical protein